MIQRMIPKMTTKMITNRTKPPGTSKSTKTFRGASALAPGFSPSMLSNITDSATQVFIFFCNFQISFYQNQ